MTLKYIFILAVNLKIVLSAPLTQCQAQERSQFPGSPNINGLLNGFNPLQNVIPTTTTAAPFPLNLLQQPPPNPQYQAPNFGSNAPGGLLNGFNPLQNVIPTTTTAAPFPLNLLQQPPPNPQYQTPNFGSNAPGGQGFGINVQGFNQQSQPNAFQPNQIPNIGNSLNGINYGQNNNQQDAYTTADPGFPFNLFGTTTTTTQASFPFNLLQPPVTSPPLPWPFNLLVPTTPKPFPFNLFK